MEDLGKSALGIRCRFSFSALGLKAALGRKTSSARAALTSSFSFSVGGTSERVVRGWYACLTTNARRLTTVPFWVGEVALEGAPKAEDESVLKILSGVSA